MKPLSHLIDFFMVNTDVIICTFMIPVLMIPKDLIVRDKSEATQPYIMYVRLRCFYMTAALTNRCRCILLLRASRACSSARRTALL